MKEYETYPDFAVYLFSQSIEYLCHVLTKKYLTRFYEKEKTHKVIGKSMVRCTGGRFLDVKIQPGKGARPIVKIQVQGKG